MCVCVYICIYRVGIVTFLSRNNSQTISRKNKRIIEVYCTGHTFGQSETKVSYKFLWSESRTQSSSSP